MKKVIIIVSIILVGTLTIKAKEYIMNAESVKYSNNKSSVTNVQDAIDELYMKAKEIVKVSNYKYLEEDSSKEEIGKDKIVVGYKKTNPTVTCEYGEDKTYGNVGAINNNKCIMNNLKKGTKYYYKIKASIEGTESNIESFKRTLGENNTIIEASDIEYNNKTIEEALNELYNKVNSNSISSNFEEIRESETNILENSIEISYIYKEASIRCEYGKVENGNVIYNKTGDINTVNKTCTLGSTEALEANTTYRYKIISTDANGVETYMIGEKTTDSSGPTMVQETITSSTGVEQKGLLGIVYLDPTDLTKACDEEAYIADLNRYDTTNPIGSKIPTGQKTGCMRWYAYKKEGNNYSLLLDHNTTALVRYGKTNGNVNYGTTSGNIGYDLAQLTSTSGWVVTPRLISADEIAQIVGKTSWSSVTNDDWFCFCGRQHPPTSDLHGPHEYAWLFDYTYDCTTYGCNIADSKPYSPSLIYGYWTNSRNVEDDFVWLVYNQGVLYGDVDNSALYGLRPVIEVPKSIFN